MSRTGRNLTLLTLLLACALVGCRSAAKSNEAAPAPFRVASFDAATHSLPAAAIWEFAPGESQFTQFGDDATRAPSAVTLLRRAISEFGAALAIEEQDFRTEYLSRDGDGNILLHAVLDEAEHALTLFEPPLLLAPPQVQPGEIVTSEAAMRIVDARDHRKQRERGTAKRTLTYVQDARLQTAGGESEAAQIEIHFTADLRLADADERTTLFVSRDDGVLVQQSEEKVTILGAFPRTTRRTLLRPQ
jgi:hypothetical protein